MGGTSGSLAFTSLFRFAYYPILGHLEVEHWPMVGPELSAFSSLWMGLEAQHEDLGQRAYGPISVHVMDDDVLSRVVFQKKD